ncbi:DUF1642 domain-containing protein [Lacticaseibacillus absianus]|uniref:DUF1642 domain-containing protein n=1 Tax=Lacticaseibacillus absianus TaxID=2729623 RepID=UPI0015C728C4|nr:DUF1642 domain-containing protein [Lacticaseibacillus absianus]
MSLWAVQNDEGEWMDDVGDFYPEEAQYGVGYVGLMLTKRSEAEYLAKKYGGHVVELVEVPAKVVVSEKEAKMLESARADKCPVTHISNFSAWYGSDDEDRLMRAYVNGYTVEKPKRWNVKVPHVSNGYYYKDSDGLAAFTAKRGRMLQERSQFTAAEIDYYGLGDCEKAEVKD